jgi:glycosyltransferase involved in cell wall biosynthesis
MKINLVHRHIPALSGKISWITRHLIEMGHEINERHDGPVSESPDQVLFLLGNANRFPRLCRELMALEPHQRPLVFLWQSEPLPPSKASGIPLPGLSIRELAKIALRDRRATDVYTNYYRLRSLHRKGLPDILTVSSLAWQEFLQEHDIPARHVPIGYSSHAHDHYEGGPKNIDVLFLGEWRIPRRRRRLQRLKKKSIPLLIKGSWHDPECWGEKRKELLNRTKILLNIQRYPGEISGFRLLQGMANRALVISEPIYKPEPYQPGVHYVSTPMDRMADTIRYYLKNTGESEKIVNAGYELVTKKLTIENSLNKMISLIRERI